MRSSSNDPSHASTRGQQSRHASQLQYARVTRRNRGSRRVIPLKISFGAWHNVNVAQGYPFAILPSRLGSRIRRLLALVPPPCSGICPTATLRTMRMRRLPLCRSKCTKNKYHHTRRTSHALPTHHADTQLSLGGRLLPRAGRSRG